MITPQEIQEKTFVKAVFGGYDMNSVDEFIEPLTTDYIALYKEVSALKNKMKVLVETIEEYRREEESVKKALVIAQKSSDELLNETQAKCTQMVSAAEALAKSRAEAYRNEAVIEEEKLNRARQSTQSYFEHVKSLCTQQLKQINDLAAMEVHSSSAPAAKAAFNIMENQDTAEVVPVAAPAPGKNTANAPQEADGGLYAELIKNGVADLAADPEPAAKPNPSAKSEPDRMDPKLQAQRTTKFEFIDLQFGKDYDPKK